MQFDIDHSTPYYRAIFGNLTEDQMIDNIDAMKILSTYHKKQQKRYILVQGPILIFLGQIL